MKSDNYLKFALGLTISLISFNIASHLLPSTRSALPSKEKTFLELKEKIKSLIQKGQLSEKEAMFYEIIEE